MNLYRAILVSLLFFPAFQVSRLIIGVGAQNHAVFTILTFPVALMIFLKFKFSNLMLLGLFITLTILALPSTSGTESFLQTLAYAASIAFGLLLFDTFKKDIDTALHIITYLLFANIAYALVQLIAYYSIGSELMFHSNVNEKYVMTTFSFLDKFYPFTFRYTGLLNENAPATALMLTLWGFLASIGRFRCLTRLQFILVIITPFVLIVGGSKSIIFLLIPFLVKYKKLFIVMALSIVIFLTEFDLTTDDYVLLLGAGQRIEAYNEFTEFTDWGIGFKSSLAGGSSLDFLGYNINAFGVYGVILFSAGLCLLFRVDRLAYNPLMIPALFASMAAAGSVATINWPILLSIALLLNHITIQRQSEIGIKKTLSPSC